MTADIDESAPIAEQAAQWWLTLRSGEVSVNERHEFDAWVARSPERVAAYLRTVLLTKAFESSKVRWPDTTAETLVDEARRSLQQGVRVLHEDSQRAMAGSRRQGSATRRWWMAAITTALFATIGTAWFISTIPQEFHTGFGEQRSVVLKDGSRVTLNSESKIRVDLGNDHRRVSLDAGEALFRVTHDPARPFEVEIGNAVVRDVGTEFNVDRRPKRTVVTVITGRVAVMQESAAQVAKSAPPQGEPGVVFLGAADRLVVMGSRWGAPQHDVNVRAAMSWTEGTLIFQHTPLSEAAEEFNRYNRGRIEIRDGQLERREVSGVFRTDNPKAFLAFLSSAPGIRIRETPDGTYVVAQN